MKHIVIANKNGEGYSDPYIRVFEDHGLARDDFHFKLGEWVTHCMAMQIFSQGFDTLNHQFVTLIDGDEDGEPIDDYGVHLFSLERGTLLVLNTDYANEFQVFQTKSIDDYKELLGIEAEDYEVVETSYTATTASIVDSETGTMYFLIYVK